MCIILAGRCDMTRLSARQLRQLVKLHLFRRYFPWHFVQISWGSTCSSSVGLPSTLSPFQPFHITKHAAFGAN